MNEATCPRSCEVVGARVSGSRSATRLIGRDFESVTFRRPAKRTCNLCCEVFAPAWGRGRKERRKQAGHLRPALREAVVVAGRRARASVPPSRGPPRSSTRLWLVRLHHIAVELDIADSNVRLMVVPEPEFS
jgi:hypothetical protein